MRRKAFQLDDANFITETIKDPWWAQRREAATMIGLAGLALPNLFLHVDG